MARHSRGRMWKRVLLDTATPLEQVYELDHEKSHPGYQPLDRICFQDIDAFLNHVAEYELE